MCREYRNKLTTAKICVGETIYIATGDLRSFFLHTDSVGKSSAVCIMSVHVVYVVPDQNGEISLSNLD